MGPAKNTNRTRLAPALLRQAMEDIASLPESERKAFETRALCIIRMLIAHGFSGRRLANLALAINFRLGALAQLVSGDHLNGWRLQSQEQGLTYLHEDIIEVAANEPLIEDEQGSISFAAHAFELRLLGLAKTKGRA